MAGGINQVQYIFLAIADKVHLDGVTFNSNAAFAFQVHVIQHGIHHSALADGFGGFDKAVGQGAFTVVDVSDNAEVADIFHWAAKIRSMVECDNNGALTFYGLLQAILIDPKPGSHSDFEHFTNLTAIYLPSERPHFKI